MAATPSGYAVQAADGQGPLPPGWQHITNQGRSFYYHAATDVSQWTRPKDDEVPHPVRSAVGVLLCLCRRNLGVPWVRCVAFVMFLAGAPP